MTFGFPGDLTVTRLIAASSCVLVACLFPDDSYDGALALASGLSGLRLRPPGGEGLGDDRVLVSLRTHGARYLIARQPTQRVKVFLGAFLDRQPTPRPFNRASSSIS